MTAPYSTAEDVVARVCGDKVRHRTEQAARAHSDSRNEAAPTAGFTPYRCPFCSRWHIGHPPSLEALQAIARVMRGLDPTPPVPHDTPARPAPSTNRRSNR